jgi:pimeloyl-ACP methyl ester carboxylesterase
VVPRSVILPLLVLFLSAGTAAQAQSPRVRQLMEVVWSQGPDAALRKYDALPATDRVPSLLVSLADQLLWTGKHQEATRLLARAESEAPLLTEVRFQQGRAALQRADRAAAQSAFRSGLAIVDRDTTLAADARGAFRRRLENRIAFLDRAHELLARSGAYRRPNGTLLLFKFDPYLNTFPVLFEPSTGVLRVLYPADAGRLEWRDEQNRPLGSIRFAAGGGNNADLVVRESSGETRVAGVGIVQEPLRFEAAGAVVDGTLVRPAGTDPVPAVVLTHGAGLSSRYNLMLEALAFAAAGVAAFVYDKPGLGSSTGANWLLLSIEEQAAYVTTVAQHLRSRPDIGPIGIWGFSQGGWVAPLVAARRSDVAFVVMVSGAAVSPQEQYAQAFALRLAKGGVPDAEVEQAVRHLRAVWTSVNTGARLADLSGLYARADSATWGAQFPRLNFQWELDWWRQNEVDAAAALRSLRVPVLALFGENDEAVPPRDNVPLLARHLAASGTGDYTITVLPGANHQLMTGNGYQPQYFPTLVDWVVRRFRERPAGAAR